MVFNSNIFLFVFFPTVFLLFWAVHNRLYRYVVLTISGFVFYGYWNWRFCGLLLFSALFSFWMALLVDRLTDHRNKTMVMATAVATDLSILGFFKYYNFFAENVQTLLPSARLPLLDIVLPIGISFYTFHTISYVIDVRFGRVRPTTNVFEYLSYVTLFSQLVAGPIVRFRQVEQDMRHLDRPLIPQNIVLGIGWFVVGFVKKVIVADQLGSWVDGSLASFGALSTLGAWGAALGYTFQLYYDFSGYSDMAVGLGFLFGIHIPYNFDAPYRAAGIADFWRRWHISLSSWLRDYLYIPLGGNRKGTGRTYANLLTTMLLGGLWHGANWTFVVWGAYHGLLLVGERLLGSRGLRLPTPLARAATLPLVVIGWVVFRSDSIGMARDWIGKLVGIGAGTAAVDPALVAWLAACLIAVNVLPETHQIRFSDRRRWAVACAAGFVAGFVFMNGRDSVFLYYQF